MAEISEDQAVLVENALTKTLDLISDDNTDVGMALKQMVTEAQQVMSAVIDGQSALKSDTAMGGPGGGS